jgi:hypothetical protein
MKYPTVCIVFLTMALMVLVACAEKPAPAPGQKPGSGVSSGDAASIGTTVPSIVELSDMYVAPETADFLKKLGPPNLPTQTDREYVLARIRFEYKARGAPGDKPWELSGVQFSAFSEDSKPYGSPSIVASQSGLKPSLLSGDTLECWLAFVVAKSDRKPVMTFNPGGAWFHLY